MKVVKCECGTEIRAESDDRLVGEVEKHVGESHPEMAGELGREQILAMAENE